MKATKLEILMEYWRMNRQVGHTNATLEGVKNATLPTFFISVNPAHRQLERENPNIRVLQPSVLRPAFLYGYQLPLAIDHYTLDVIFEEHNAELTERLL